jgi:hypothetical protein
MLFWIIDPERADADEQLPEKITPAAGRIVYGSGENRITNQPTTAIEEIRSVGEGWLRNSRRVRSPLANIRHKIIKSKG